MHLARGITDNNGRTVICLGFKQSLHGLVLIRTHRDLSDVNVSVRHCYCGEILLADRLTGSRELCDLTELRSLGRLSAGV